MTDRYGRWVRHDMGPDAGGSAPFRVTLYGTLEGDILVERFATSMYGVSDLKAGTRHQVEDPDAIEVIDQATYNAAFLNCSLEELPEDEATMSLEALLARYPEEGDAPEGASKLECLECEEVISAGEPMAELMAPDSDRHGLFHQEPCGEAAMRKGWVQA